MDKNYKYDRRGVSATKDEVHSAIKNLDKGIFPTAFCKILPDIVAGDGAYCNIMHADTAGTKTSLAYLYWKETGDLSVWEGIAQDAIVMNIDDMACVGCLQDIVLSSTIGRNKHLITGDVIATIIKAAQDFIAMMKSYGISIHGAGGETADVGDIVRTIDVGYTTFARMKRSDVIINDIQANNVIVGLASYGKASYENAYNSGIGSNGLTSARHDVLSKYYANTHKESYNPSTPEDVVYIGKYRLTDTISIQGEDMPIGKLLLSPTRTYLPVLHKILSQYKEKIKGIIHNTGGGQTKVMKFAPGTKIIKDNLLPIPPIFELIQEASGSTAQEMYQVFNMGTRLEFYTDEMTAVHIIEIAKSFDIDAQIIGRVESSKDTQLEITDTNGTYIY